MGEVLTVGLTPLTGDLLIQCDRQKKKQTCEVISTGSRWHSHVEKKNPEQTLRGVTPARTYVTVLKYSLSQSFGLTGAETTRRVTTVLHSFDRDTEVQGREVG